MTDPHGVIVTFYSFKGGVGRTMALANAAVLLAKRGKRVLVVDFDLEAPGLDKYYGEFSSPHAGTVGLVDFLWDARQRVESDWRDYTVEVHVGGEHPIVLMPSGRRDDDYAERVLDLDLRGFFAKHEGGTFFEKLRDAWAGAFDYCLIDSRTGLTDVGGVCTVLLPDVLIPVFAANEQSLEGARDVVMRAQAARKHLPFDRGPLLVFPLPSRFEGRQEFKQSQQWLNRFAKEMAPLCDDWLPPDRALAALEKVKIPYVAYFSFGENLPVLTQGTNDPEGMGFAFATATDLLLSVLEAGSWHPSTAPNDILATLPPRAGKEESLEEQYTRRVKNLAMAWSKAGERDSKLLARSECSAALELAGRMGVVPRTVLRYLARSMERRSVLRWKVALALCAGLLAAAAIEIVIHLRRDRQFQEVSLRQLQQTSDEASRLRAAAEDRQRTAEQDASRAKQDAAKSQKELAAAQQRLDQATKDLGSASANQQAAQAAYLTAKRNFENASEKAAAADARADSAAGLAEALARVAKDAMDHEQQVAAEAAKDREARGAAEAALEAQHKRAGDLQTALDGCHHDLQRTSDDCAEVKGRLSKCNAFDDGARLMPPPQVQQPR